MGYFPELHFIMSCVKGDNVISVDLSTVQCMPNTIIDVRKIKLYRVCAKLPMGIILFTVANEQNISFEILLFLT